MRILGIDPGIARTGWGLINYEKGKPTALAYGCIETDKSEPFLNRLLILNHAVKKLIQEYVPEIVAAEELFFNTNVTTALTVGQARGVVLLAVAEKQLPLFVYTPLQVKIGVTGYGRAEKSQVGHMVKTILKLPSIPKPDDTADALAIALTHAFSSKSPC